MEIIVQLENNSGALLYIDSADISSIENIFCDTSARSVWGHALCLLPCFLYFLSNHTHIKYCVLAQNYNKRFMISNKAFLNKRGSMGAEFLEKKALFDIMNLLL